MARISRSEKSLAIVLFMRSYALSFQLPGACVVSLPEGGRGGAMLVDGSAGGNDGGRKRFVRRSVYSFCLFSDLLQCPLHRTPAQQQFAGLGFVKPRRFGDHPRSAGHELVVGQLHVDHAVALDTPQADHLIPQQVQASPQEPLLLAQRLQQLQKQQPQTLRQMCSTSTWQVSRITLILH